MSVLAPVQGVGLKLKRYRIYNQQVDLVNNTVGGSVINPLVVNDTTAVSTTATSYTQVKSYSINIPQNDFGHTVVNAIRVQIYGYVSAGTGNLSVLINGAAPTMLKTIVGSTNTASFTNTSSALVFDGIISLSGISSPYTLSIQADNSTSGDTTYIADVYAFQGLAITSTSATTVDQQETTPSNTILDEIGLSYSGSGLRLLAYVIRYTTATATITSTDNFTPSGKTAATLSIAAANDSVNSPVWFYEADNDNNDQVPTGYNGSITYTVQSYVGASGDILLIGSLRAWFGFHSLTFPKDPHIGFAETSFDAVNISTSLSVVSNIYTGTWTGLRGGVLNLFSVSTSGYVAGQIANGWFNIDETSYILLGYSGHILFWYFAIEVLE